MKLLLAEDERSTRFLLAAALGRWGYTVTAVEDGAAAWKVLESEPIRLVVSDWEMPELDGPSLCKRVRARVGTPYVYFVLFTQHADSNSIAQGLAAGADDFIAKPFDPTVTRTRLEVGRRLVSLHDDLAAKTATIARLDAEIRVLRGKQP